ncbi:MAG: hypothetical protein K8F91_01135 [Candidatus Obscuribacterales bacterium]|nr:hypothetical protein [Candidatus Obscuribacterales bacterium]
MVDKRPPHVSKKWFDPGNPPNPGPDLKSGEKGATRYHYNLSVNFDLDMVSKEKTESGYKVKIRPKDIRVTLTLPIIMWLPQNTTRKMLAHEEGHVRICEFIYYDAEKLVRFHAESMASSHFAGEGKTEAESVKVAYRRAAEDLNQIYRRYVFDYSRCVGEEYDRLTRHGLDPLPEDIAIDKAFDGCGGYRSEFEEIRELGNRRKHIWEKTPMRKGGSPGRDALK